MRGLLISFFFQAEDGIRDLYVTGVQTCALPISGSRAAFGVAELDAAVAGAVPVASRVHVPAGIGGHPDHVLVQIGRASCRERVEVAAGAGSLKKKPIAVEATNPEVRPRIGRETL